MHQLRRLYGKFNLYACGDALRDIIPLAVVPVRRSPAVCRFCCHPAGVVIFICHRRIGVFCLRQAAQAVIAEGGVTQRAVAVALRHRLVRHLVSDIITAVKMCPFRESGADAAACGVILIAQRASGEVGFSNQLSGLIVLQAVMFAFRVDDVCQAGDVFQAFRQYPQ